MKHWHYCPGCSYDYECEEPCDEVVIEPNGKAWACGYPCSEACAEKIRIEDEKRAEERRVQRRRQETLRRLTTPAEPAEGVR